MGAAQVNTEELCNERMVGRSQDGTPNLNLEEREEREDVGSS